MCWIDDRWWDCKANIASETAGLARSEGERSPFWTCNWASVAGVVGVKLLFGTTSYVLVCLGLCSY